MHPLKINDWFDDRHGLKESFLIKTGWQSAKLSSIGEDCAFRRYFRLELDDKSAVLMEAVPDDGGFATPGHRISDFIAIGKMLLEHDVHTPQIYDIDEKNGYMLLEDMGDISFKKALGQNNEEEIYTLATDVLAHIKNSFSSNDHGLPNYYESHVHKGRQRIVDWYIPAQRMETNSDELRDEYLKIWDDIEARMPACPQGFLHIDYHVENLMWCDGYKGLKRCGVLDFQGAMWGPAPYDLANLLEDARIDVDENIRVMMIDRYAKDMTADESQTFKAWYRVLATQFHCRLAGQFIRLAVLDGKTRYLEYIPRVISYLDKGLQDPILKPLSEWFSAQDIHFDRISEIDPLKIKPFIREDAF